MRFINRYIMSLISLFLMSSCVNELDNYDAPDGGIHGTIIDAETNKPVPLPVQGSTGVIIKLMEQGTEAMKTVDFYAKQDGTFDNSRIFNCDYLITVDGPFVERGEVKANIKGQTKVDIPVVPFARIDCSATMSGKKIMIDYQVHKTSADFTTDEVYGYWNFAPGVDDGGANQAGKITATELSGTMSLDLTSDQTFLDNEYKIRANGNKIFVRVGAKTNGEINYSEVKTVYLQ